ncbi:hypothetical protein JRO89_XS12G0247400 [Xanthoceras sorbifolium]|uniref:Pentatricopeptide repeat-containing protein n=1 Tax=Xanthoceras sorbifolium TaxID=99658 RepID=A0ABQ8HDQ0_9ROSI|nr:hypothetical protein JRO89_XS12G0247400 [Xanthoceras sorbifolium]
MHARMVVNGFNSSPWALRELIFCSAMVIPCTISYAHKMFAEITEQDTFMYNTMISGSAQSQTPLNAVCYMPRWRMGLGFLECDDYWVCEKQGEMEKARELFNEVPKRDVVTWNAMIAGYVLGGLNERALEMFEEMRSVGERPDEGDYVEFVVCLHGFEGCRSGEKVHSAILEMSSGGMNILLGNALIDMYAKCGSIETAMGVFHGMREKDVSSWNSVIGGLAFHGHAEESIALFSEMQRLKVRPNEITFVGVLVACSHAGKVEEGQRYFKLMKDRYKIEPNIRHYGCMVDLLGRAGLLNETFEFIDRMEIEPNAIIWRTLLGACRIHGNVELGRRANERLLKMRKDESGDYVLLSNIYASRGEWDGVQNVRKLMDDSGVRKEPGRSLVDADDTALMHFLFNSQPKSRKPVS